MRLLFIHGINQGEASTESLNDVWRELLIRNANAPELFRTTDSKMAYYADILAEAYHADLLSADLAHQAMESDQDVTPAGKHQAEMTSLPLSASIPTLLGGEPEFDWQNPVVMLRRIWREAIVYFTNADVRRRIDARVREQLVPATSGASRLIIVGHSLGTVIAFKLLREIAREQSGLAPNDSRRLTVPLLVTVGSALPIRFVRDALGPPFACPSLVEKWWNFYDIVDPVTTGRGLVPPLFQAGISNDGTVKNGSILSHQIIGYLPHKALIGELELALGAG
jgi:hypothetical protein